jgi:mRNA interferase HigB
MQAVHFHRRTSANSLTLAPTVGACYESDVRVFSRQTLVDFWTRHRDAEQPLRLWFAIVERAAWRRSSDIKAIFGTADFLADNRVVFDIKGNAHRIVVHVKYAPLCLVYIRFVGTHAEYDRIDATTV